MIDSKRRHPYRRVVAVLTHIGCQNVGRVLAGRRDAVVAIDTAARDVGVVKVGG